MPPGKEHSDNLGLPRSTEARVVDLLEGWLHTSAVIGSFGMVVTGALLVLYLVLGGILTAINSPVAPPHYLSVIADPWIFLGGSIAAGFTVQSTASRILYRMLTDFEDRYAELVLLLNYIGLGFGAAALRFLLPQAIEFLVSLV